MLPKLKRTTPPATLPVTLDEVKARLRVMHDDDDAVLTRLIKAVTASLDTHNGLLGRCMVDQVWQERFTAFPCGRLYLALSPVSEIQELSYIASDGSLVGIDSALFELADEAEAPFLQMIGLPWPPTDARRALPVIVRYKAGYGAAEDVPEPIREAIMLHVGSLYERRDALSEAALSVTPLGFNDLIRPYWKPAI